MPVFFYTWSTIGEAVCKKRANDALCAFIRAGVAQQARRHHDILDTVDM